MAKRDGRWVDASEFRPDPAVMDHDPEEAMREGMSTDAAGVDASETEASTGDSEGAFVGIAAGAATGLGIDRGEAVGAGGLAAGEDLDPVAEGDYWRENYRRRPCYRAEKPYEHIEPGYRFGWEEAAGLEFRDRRFEDVETELARRWEARRPPEEPGWVDVREAVRDSFHRVRDSRRGSR